MTAPTPDQVTRAMCKALGYDPEAHDIDPVKGRWPGFRVVLREGRTPVRFMRKAEFDALLKDPEIVIAFKTFLEGSLRN